MGVPGPPNFSWVVEGRLAGLAMPREPGHYRYLRERGVRHLVSLTERAPPHHGCCPQIQLHRFRVPDFTPPSLEQIQSFLQIVEEANGRGEVWPRTRRKGTAGGHLGDDTRGTPGGQRREHLEQATGRGCGGDN
uniref:Swiss Army Knife protein DSP-PTPase phosphatase domain-containing protein n=1 Tax=Cyanoderma ruficeps TaxID=181631 RepID=A0A8C3P404_9PASS